MRIPQTELKDKKPVAEYHRVINGIIAVIQIYGQPCCCNVMQIKDGQFSSHAYPLTLREYGWYLREAAEWLNPNEQKFTEQALSWYDKYMQCEDEKLCTFYYKVAKSYASRIGRTVEDIING